MRRRTTGKGTTGYSTRDIGIERQHLPEIRSHYSPFGGLTIEGHLLLPNSIEEEPCAIFHPEGDTGGEGTILLPNTRIMTVCKSNSLSCLQAAKPGPPPPPPAGEAATDSTATLNKLALATGGAEKSWHRCVFPFGAVALVIGIAATCITFKFRGPHMDIAKAVSVAALAAGVALLVAAFLCWRSRRERQKRRREEAEAEEQGGL